MKGKGKRVLLGAIGVVVVLYLLNQAMVTDQADCSVEKLAAAAGADTTLTHASARWFPAQHCLVKGYVTTTDPGPNRVNFVLQLPERDDWNGRYYFIGLGGAAGRTPTLSELPFGYPVSSGFAVAGSDTGHKSTFFNPLDWSFLSDKAKTLDHLHRGAHVSAVATQAITRAYFNADSMYRYHSGCSGGGRMGVMAALHHPEDYDGYLIGAPGITTANILNFMWIAQQMDKLPAKKFEKDKLRAMEQAIIAQCDASDGIIDQMIRDPQKCQYDPGHLLCDKDQDESTCFTNPELAAIKSIMAGPQSPSGQVYPGLTPTNPSGWPFFLNLMGKMIATSFSKAYFGPDFDFMQDFDFSNQGDIDAWWQAVEETGFGLRASADYSEMEKSGGKVIFWHGVSDPAISVLDQIAYYDEIRAAAGSEKELNAYSRMYLAPGLFHCVGGPGPADVPDRLLEALVAWVEQDAAPGAVVAQRGAEAYTFDSQGIFDYLPNPMDYIDRPPPGTPPREFLLCPYPQEAVYAGADRSAPALYDAGNWNCKLSMEN